jgi:hypothetical protein
MKIYAIDITEYHNRLNIDEPDEIEDKVFIDIAEEQGYVWSLDELIYGLNSGDVYGLPVDNLWFRAIEEENA